MQRTKRIPESPRYDYARDKADEVIVEFGIKKYPINPFELIDEEHLDILCITLDEAKKLSNKEYNMISQCADGISFYSRDDNQYIIVYNNDDELKNSRIRWTIAHELGHILLGHLTDFEDTALCRCKLTDKQYGVLEREAHAFAAELLAPYLFLAKIEDISSDIIRAICYISDDAAKKRVDHYNKKYLKPGKFYPLLFKNLYAFLSNDLGSTIYEGSYRAFNSDITPDIAEIAIKCTKCYSVFKNSNQKYCIYCGSEIKRLDLFDFSSQKESFVKQRTFKKIDFKNQVSEFSTNTKLFCYNCRNEDISYKDSFCTICGHQIFNVCLKENKKIDSHALYCPDCGGRTSYYDLYKNFYQNRVKDSFVPKIECSEYEFWDYIAYKTQNIPDLHYAIIESDCFIDDDDVVMIVVRSKLNESIIEKYKINILSIMNDGLDFKYENMEVIFRDI